MKFTLAWLKDHLDTEAALASLSDKLSAVGMEVEGVEDRGAALAPFTVARVLEARPHPNADRLKVLKVETGSGVFEVVCGAANARTGLIGVFAPVGSYIPGKALTLEARPVRGVVSAGMLLSAAELKISEDDDGIIELPATLAGRVGERFADVSGLADPVIEVKLTPNRPDCTGVRGIARDLAAAGLGRLKPEPAITGVDGDFACPIEIELTFPAAAADACPCFAGRYLRGVNNARAPAWIEQRLTAVGLRPINALVDVTNYISLDRGRPLHVYDADKLTGAIRARLGRQGESFRGLDGKTHAVDDSMCVIADDRAVLGFGGILGGEDTGVTTDSKNVLIECAYFDPVRTAATGRKTGIISDARYRFERGVDPAFIIPGLDLATAMMLEVAGGAPSRAKIAGAPPAARTVVDFPFALVEKLAGIRLEEQEIRGTLEALGFSLAGKGSRSKVTVPSWRPDVGGPADLVEEVVRIAGLDRVPSAPMPRPQGVAPAVLTETQRRVRRARRELAARGMVEAITWSFIGHDTASRFGGGAAELELANPISSEMTSMRPSLLPGLLAAAQRNRHRGFADLALFEVGQIYRDDTPSGQILAAAGVRLGNAGVGGGGRHWTGAAATAGVFDAKADVVALLAGLGFDAARARVERAAPAWFHPGRSGVFRLGPKTLMAAFGELHPEVLDALDVAGPVAAFELFVAAVPSPKKKALARAALELVDLLPVRRDFAFVLDQQVAASDVVRAVEAADKTLISGVKVFDLFEGASIGAGKKSLALEVTLQPTDKTLTDAEIEAVSAKVVAEVKKATGGDIRR
ncbi:MAG TPA: phenylalanine--tRNA ligase subunit beta [Hyphomicrobiaceae bacterium]|nr:phenylalanine--tRNA ligase subunit beta [Hyphomicrobiaceae bacterium]